jgi:hypothetical protein
LANERSQQAQENVNKSMMSAALQIVPTSITMVDSLSRAWKNFPDMTGVLTTLGTNVSMVGNKALVASVSVAAFVGGFVVGYEAITQFGDALGPAGRALMVIVPGIIAAAAAVWALQEGLTLGVATVALVASGVAIGAMVANLQGYGNAIGMATGGVVSKPTFAVVGEAGPEIVMPLAQYEAQRSSSSGQTFESERVPDIINVYVTNNIQTEADYDLASQHTIESLNEKLAHRRSSI